MAGARFTVEVDDLRARRGLRALQDAGQDTTELMDEIGGAMVASTQQRFETGRGPGGNPWPASLRAQLEGGQTLRDSGRLAQSITHRAGRDQVEWGTNVIYAAIHQFGGTIQAKGGGYLHFPLADGSYRRVKQVTIPARPFLGVDDGDETEIRAITEDYLRRAAGAGGSLGA